MPLEAKRIPPEGKFKDLAFRTIAASPEKENEFRRHRGREPEMRTRFPRDPRIRRSTTVRHGTKNSSSGPAPEIRYRELSRNKSRPNPTRRAFLSGTRCYRYASK